MHADIYESLAELELAPAVPERIHDAFLTARHLALYSWFVYRFTMIAQLQAYASLEYALRERLGHSDEDRPPALRRLLDEAIEMELIDEKKIRDWPGHSSEVGVGLAGYSPGEWLRLLPEIMATLRNDLAHGSFSLYPDSGHTLRVVADIVNQLYPESTGAAT